MTSLFSGLTKQATAMLPSLIQNAEPQIEQQLRTSLRGIKATKPAESQIFLTNWKKLDKAVREELGAPSPVMGAKRRRTRKNKKRT